MHLTFDVFHKLFLIVHSGAGTLLIILHCFGKGSGDDIPGNFCESFIHFELFYRYLGLPSFVLERGLGCHPG